jgi:conjugal transfer pilus assembly protein TraV
MTRALYPLGMLALSCVSLSSCASLGSNISGSFDCKAPGGSCAPTSQIDAAASVAMLDQSPSSGRRNLTSAAQTARTGERVLKIVFPGFVDASGNLHEARSVHVVARSPDWAATLAGDNTNIARQMARDIADQAKQASKDHSGDALSADDNASETPSESIEAADPFLKSSYNLPSRGSYPLTVREAIAGASMPAIEGFDGLPPPASRTPHPVLKAFPNDGLPSIKAIEAAKIRGAQKRPSEENGQ